MSYGSFKRRKYFINKELQGKFIFHYFIFLTLGSLMFVGILSFFSSNTLSMSYDNYHLQLGTTPEILFKNILSAEWSFIVFGGILISFITLRLTHRVAGPFFRFEKALNEMIHGNISRKIILRPKDEGKGLAKKINTFNDRLSENLVLMEEMSSKIAISARNLELAIEKGQTDEIAGLLDTIKTSQRGIESTVHEYTFNVKPGF